MKHIDELKNSLEAAKTEAQTLLNAKNTVAAQAKMDEINDLKASIKIQEQLDIEALEDAQNKIETEKVDNKMDEKNTKQTANSVRALIKKGMGKRLTEAENALLIPASGNGTSGEGYLLPQDINTIIVEKIRQYKSFRDVLGYIPTTALSGSFPVESFETLSELVDFTDGVDGTEASDVTFTTVSFKLKEKGALITLSNTLLAMTDNALIQYIAGVFAKKAVVTENKMAIAALKLGKTSKAIADWKALKKSINVDLDEGVKYGACVCTNQDGFDMLDSALDEYGRPVLQPNPALPTSRLFMGYPVHVFSGSLLPTLGTTTKKAPIFYGNVMEGAKFVDAGAYEFATSSEAGFKSNTTIARIITHLDAVQTDASDKMYIFGEITLA
ncbi:phage major capsid protein [Paenibacillus sp. 19GGS1-52]|uniref:phage major capsid protein n=1 Tax=Paenibacillus sp. 19GGS1-52 TaxID=2758563 RepID=UPI001EFB0AD3|nr:phage major capsid protein [Paenibacillus sp. 19GGS1-52]ULO09664.1 phage major capsid protein [Paenibacillus sp. 19GGS1-52]